MSSTARSRDCALPAPDERTTLTAATLRRLEAAQQVLLSPLDYPSIDDWRSAVNRHLRKLLHADAAGFLLPGVDGPLFYSDELDPDVLAAFPDLAPPPLMDGTPLELQMERLGVATVEQGYGPHFDRYLNSPYYDEYARPARAHDTLAAVLPLDGLEAPGTANLHFWHSRPEGRRFGRRETSILRLLYPAFEAGVRTALRTVSSRAALAASLDARSDGVLVYDLGGRLLHRNPAVGRIVPTGRAEETLIDAGREMARGLGAGDPVDLLSPRNAARTVSTRMADHELTAVRLAEGVFTLGAVAVVTVAAGPEPLPDRATLRERFGLTRRQAEVALLLARRKTNPEIAETLSISPHTARHHTAAVMGKLGVRDRLKIGRALREGGDG